MPPKKQARRIAKRRAAEVLEKHDDASRRVRLSAKLDPYVRHSTSLGIREARQQFRDKRPKISETIRGRTYDNDRDLEGWEILLKG